MSGAKVLLVEDEPHIARGLVFNLERQGCRVVHVVSGEEALACLERETFSLVVLDLMLPGIDGLEVCRRLRARDARLPVLMLTARSEDEDRVEGLASGADDYVTKPFHLEEFLLRVRGMLRRSRWYRPEDRASALRFRFGGNDVDLERRVAHTPRGEVQLTELEARVLEAFFRQEGKVLARPQLYAEVWGIAADAESRTLDNFIVRMRKYFEDDPADPRHFLTVRGQGYRFESGRGEGGEG